MRVSDVMTQATITDTPADTLRSAAELMWRQQTGSLVVMEDGRLVGIITERDLLRAVAQGQELEKVTVGETMTRQLHTVGAGESVRSAARLMAQHWIRHLPVTEDGRVVGVLSQRDVVGLFAALWQEDDWVEIPVDRLVREQRLLRIERGDLD